MKALGVRVLPSLAGLAVVLGGWEMFVRIEHIGPLVLPRPSAIGAEVFAHLGVYLTDARVTLIEALLGFALALVVSVSLAAAMVHFRFIDRAFDPLQVMVKNIPVVAFSPALVVWLGFGREPKVIMAALISFSPLLVNALAGFRSVDQAALDLLTCVNASRWEVLCKLRVHYALPYLFSGAKVAVSSSLIGAVVAEWNGSSEGLGYRIISAQKYLATTALWGSIAVLVVMALILTGLVALLERRLLHWHVSQLSTSK